MEFIIGVYLGGVIYCMLESAIGISSGEVPDDGRLMVHQILFSFGWPYNLYCMWKEISDKR